MCAQIAPLGERRLRPWSVDDAAVLVAAWNDAEIARWNPVPPDATLAFATKWIEGTRSQNIASVGIDVVMVDVENNVIGEVGLQVDPQRAIAEIGFWVAKKFRSEGHGPALLDLTCALGSRLELVGLVALTDSENAPATSLLERCGWSEVSTKSERRAFAKRLPRSDVDHS